MISTLLERSLADLADLLPRVRALGPELERLAGAMLGCFNAGGKLLVAGNGGSAAEAMHLAEELVVRFRKNRRALPAISLTDATVLTCAGNDFGYESVFERQVEAFGKPGDVLLALTTSGNSPNLLRALTRARQLGLTTAGLLGNDGGKARPLCDIALVVPSSDTARIQEAHTLLFHTLCEYLDAQFA